MSGDDVHPDEMHTPDDFDDAATHALFSGSGRDIDPQLADVVADMRMAYVSKPPVVGAVIELGYCLDLLTSTGVQAVTSAHIDFVAYCREANAQAPLNSGGQDSLFRRLDCAVINHLHSIRDNFRRRPFDSVRGVFIEGDPLYPSSGFYHKTHIQICIRNTSMIKGVFRVPDDQLSGNMQAFLSGTRHSI